MSYANSDRISVVRAPLDPKSIMYFIRAGKDKPASFDILHSQAADRIILSLYQQPNWVIPDDCSIIGGGLSKYHAIHQARQLLRFNYIFLLDADIELPDFSDHRLIEKLDSQNRLNCAQLSLCKESYTAFGFLRSQGKKDFRRVNFVEVMAPIFSAAGIDLVIDTFPKSISTWGLDYAWSKIYSGNHMYVIDSETMTHRGKPDLRDGDFYKYLRSLNKDPVAEMEALKREFSCDDLWIGNVPPMMNGFLFGKLKAKLVKHLGSSH